MNNISWKKIIKILLIVLCCIVSFGIITVIIGYKKIDNSMNLVQQIDKEEVKKMTNENITKETKSRLKENWTVAIFGLDSRDNKIEKGGNSDVIILASVNNKTGDVRLLSVYRDTCLKTGKDRYKKVNEAYAIGGPKKAVEVLNENLDIEIDDYIAVNWEAVAEAINMLGGINMEITKSELKYINGYITETVNSTGIGSSQLKNVGMQHIDGVQSVAYSRIRYTEGNDFRRTERQRDVINAVLNKAKTTNFSTLNNIIVTVFPKMSTSIDTEDVLELVTNIFKYKIVETEGFPFDLKSNNKDKQYFVFPDKLEDNVIKLHDFLYGVQDYEVSETVKTISNTIENKYLGIGTQISKPKITETIPEINSETALNPTEVTETESSEIVEETTVQESIYPEVYGPGYFLPEDTVPETTEEETCSIETGMAESVNKLEVLNESETEVSADTEAETKISPIETESVIENSFSKK